MLERVMVCDLWKASGGDVKIVLISKWRNIAITIDSGADVHPGAMVATLQAMYDADSLSAGQKTDWDTEEADLTTALFDVATILTGQIPR